MIFLLNISCAQFGVMLIFTNELPATHLDTQRGERGKLRQDMRDCHAIIQLGIRQNKEGQLILRDKADFFMGG